MRPGANPSNEDIAAQVKRAKQEAEAEYNKQLLAQSEVIKADFAKQTEAASLEMSLFQAVSQVGNLAVSPEIALLAVKAKTGGYRFEKDATTGEVLVTDGAGQRVAG